jgi:hypothetical protein
MRWSEERILTTHAGSLPRPPELVRLYARRAQGEAVDAGKLEVAGREALAWVVPKQLEAGVDVGNNGEQQREGFFLYVQHRMSGFGGSWQRRQRADVVRYPVFQRMMQEQQAGRTAVSNFQPPKAIGEVRYLDPAAVNAECEDFVAVLDRTEGDYIGGLGGDIGGAAIRGAAHGHCITIPVHEFHRRFAVRLPQLGRVGQLGHAKVQRLPFVKGKPAHGEQHAQHDKDVPAAHGRGQRENRGARHLYRARPVRSRGSSHVSLWIES